MRKKSARGTPVVILIMLADGGTVSCYEPLPSPLLYSVQLHAGSGKVQLHRQGFPSSHKYSIQICSYSIQILFVQYSVLFVQYSDFVRTVFSFVRTVFSFVRTVFSFVRTVFAQMTREEGWF